MVIEARIRRWGNSFGVLVTKENIKSRNLHENETVLIDIKKKKGLDSLFGICKFKKSTKELMSEIKEGYND